MTNILDLANIKRTATLLLRSPDKQKDLFLHRLSETLQQNVNAIIEANKKDLKDARIKKLAPAFIERLILDEYAIEHVILKLEDIKKLKCGLGECIEKRVNKQGLRLRKIRVPLGVIAVIYEARPEVTIDVAALCVKSGNVAILKGGSEALNTNKVLYRCIRTALQRSGLSKHTVSFISTSDRRVTDALLKQHEYIDLVIARGGYNLVKTVLRKSTIPVLAHAAGGARIYIDKSAELSIAENIILNAKISKPAACNSLDTIVIHRNIPDNFVKRITKALQIHNVNVISNQKAMETDWDTEFLGLTVAIKLVKDVQEAVSFINKHSKRHSEGIIAQNKKVIDYFIHSIDAAALFINCSTRLHDGYIFGLGSEIGIATAKLHARGPVGLKELTTYKWHVFGTGQIRQ